MLLGVEACGIYSFTGASIPSGASTFQVNFFENQAGSRPGSTVEPGLDRDFTLALQDIILGQTNLNLVNSGGDLVYEGEFPNDEANGWIEVELDDSFFFDYKDIIICSIIF